MHLCANTLSKKYLSLILLHIPLSLYLRLYTSLAANENNSKRKRSEHFAAFCLLIEQSPINFALLVETGNTLNERLHQN
jgi:hypothetical protein